METVRRLRAMASLCRQTSAHHPDRSWKLLAEAEFWEHLDIDMLRRHFEQWAAGFALRPVRHDQNAGESSARIAAGMLAVGPSPVRPCAGRLSSSVRPM